MAAKAPDPADALAAALADLAITEFDPATQLLEAFRQVASARNWGVDSPVWRKNWNLWFKQPYTAAQNPFKDEKHCAYFDEFGTFVTNPRSTLEQQFTHLANHQGWVKGTAKWESEHDRLYTEKGLHQTCGEPKSAVDGPYNAYFDKFEDFNPSRWKTLNQELNDLAKHQGWKKGDEDWKRERAELFGAEFATFFGTEGTLKEWQKFCASVGVGADLPSITACKKALKSVFINIVNVLEHERNADIPVIKHKNFNSFLKYTKAGKMFPLSDAKENKFLKALLRKLF
ncbi:hypothetical protein K490DRAFT_64674 [Saccharata proteae CBS 121410]|uniref:Uncharacterized protein n=1 Tax=Saccharata proteae CBS 121410 TaxID=1314787 RepID=A0A9P4HV49_9PEZI|nr:hypothetical protein K490DRAFT_64674 [Saccharata proteae CBS 121410]